MRNDRMEHFKKWFRISWLFIGCVVYCVYLILIVCRHPVQKSEHESIFISKETSVPKCTTCVGVQSITANDLSTELPSVSIQHITLPHSALVESRYTPSFETPSISNVVTRVSVSLSETKRECEPRATHSRFRTITIGFERSKRNQGDTGTNILRDCVKFLMLSLFFSFFVSVPLFLCFTVLGIGVDEFERTLNGRNAFVVIGTGLISSTVIGTANNISDYEISILCLSRLPIWVIGAWIINIGRGKVWVAWLLFSVAYGMDTARFVGRL
jgi:hypothetical protein